MDTGTVAPPRRHWDGEFYRFDAAERGRRLAANVPVRYRLDRRKARPDPRRTGRRTSLSLALRNRITAFRIVRLGAAAAHPAATAIEQYLACLRRVWQSTFCPCGGTSHHGMFRSGAKLI